MIFTNDLTVLIPTHDEPGVETNSMTVFQFEPLYNYKFLMNYR